MSFAAALRELFLNNSAIAAQIGTKLYPYRVEQSVSGDFPAAIYELSLPMPSKDLSMLNEPHWETELTIAALSRDYGEAIGIASLFRNAIDCYCGLIGETNVKWVHVLETNMEHETEPEFFAQVVKFTLYTLQEPNFLT